MWIEPCCTTVAYWVWTAGRKEIPAPPYRYNQNTLKKQGGGGGGDGVGKEEKGRGASPFAIKSGKLEISIMEKNMQTGKALGWWSCKDPILNHMLDKSGLKPHVKKQSRGFFYFLYVQEIRLLYSKNKQHLW